MRFPYITMKFLYKLNEGYQDTTTLNNYQNYFFVTSTSQQSISILVNENQKVTNTTFTIYKGVISLIVVQGKCMVKLSFSRYISCMYHRWLLAFEYMNSLISFSKLYTKWQVIQYSQLAINQKTKISTRQGVNIHGNQILQQDAKNGFDKNKRNIFCNNVQRTHVYFDKISASFFVVQLIPALLRMHGLKYYKL